MTAAIKYRGGPAALTCPECDATGARVVDSRAAEAMDLPAIYRRRCCAGCGHRWNTIEIDADLLGLLLEDEKREAANA